MNCGNTYYFIDDCNDICKCKNGVQKEFSEKLELLDLIDDINEIIDENEKLKKSKKGQELEIVRLHHLTDAMSGVLRELGIYDVYNKEQINKVKKELKQ